MFQKAPSVGFIPLLLEELAPTEGRLGASLRMALCCVIVVLLSMSQEVPEAALSCYLVFFATRNNAATGVLIAVGLVVAASVGILLGVLVLQLASDEPMVRLSLIAAFTFAGMFFSVATKAGSIAATVGFVFAFVLTLNDFVPFPELLVRGLSWMWVVVFFPMATLVLVNCLIGPNPLTLARHAISKRLIAAAQNLRGTDTASRHTSRLLAEDYGDLATAARLGGLLGFGPRTEANRLATMLPNSQQILAGTRGSHPDPMLAADLERLAASIQKRLDVPTNQQLTSLSRYNTPLAQEISLLAGIWAGHKMPPKQAPAEPAQPADTFTNPAYLHFALKTLLAVLITYAIYTVGDWFEIHTAMITCFYVALGTTGETLHKATLRIVGCILGAALGVFSIVFLMPHMTDIGHLLLLVGVCSFLAAWVSNGSSLIQYAGWQMALAFFLCVLHGFGPSIDINVATDRILGILIGNVVVTAVFLSLWPSSVAQHIGEHLSKAIMSVASASRRTSAGVATSAAELGQAALLKRLLVFEPSWLRKRSPLLPHVTQIMTAIDNALPEVARLQMLQQSRKYLSRAPRTVKAATRAQEASTAEFLTIAADAIWKTAPEARTMLDQPLRKLVRSLRRLERLEQRASRTAPWRFDLLQTIKANKNLLLGFTRTLEAM